MKKKITPKPNTAQLAYPVRHSGWSNLCLRRCRRHHQTKLQPARERDKRRHLVRPPLQGRWEESSARQRRRRYQLETLVRRRAHVTAKTRPGPCTVGRRCGRRRRPPPRRATEPAARRNGTDDKREKGGGRRPAAGGEDSLPVRWIGGARDSAIWCADADGGDHRSGPDRRPGRAGPGLGRNPRRNKMGPGLIP